MNKKGFSSLLVIYLLLSFLTTFISLVGNHYLIKYAMPLIKDNNQIYLLNEKLITGQFVKNLIVLSMMGFFLIIGFQLIPQYVFWLPLISGGLEVVYLAFLSGDVLLMSLPILLEVGVLMSSTITSLATDYLLTTPILVFIWGW